METKAHYTLTKVEEHDLPARIMEILGEHKGIGNAITGIRIARRFGYRNDRKVRLVIQQLIAQGYPIGASVSEPFGYFVVETEAEATAYELVLHSRAVKTFERLRDFRLAVTRTMGIPFQPMLLRTDGMEVDAAQAVRDADENEMW